MKRENDNRIFVYVAGPYTRGDTEQNVKNAIATANEVRDQGEQFVPFVPHLFHFWHAEHERSYEDWMDIDFAMLRRCDVLLRLDGDSPGGDREVAFARGAGIPVVSSVGELLGACPVGNDGYYRSPEVRR